jgi:pyruvate formate lyase activating enzyme
VASEHSVQRLVQLRAESPFELRVRLGRSVADSDVHSALASGEVGFIHSFTAGSAADGPGVRVVAFTTGCLWRCLYCHNPDTWTLTNGIPVTLTHALETLRKYRYELKVMSGGFTLSGGEPLMQDRFAVRFLGAARGMGIHTALDTNGYLGERLSDTELDAIDIYVLDIKGWNPDRHRRLTGMDIEPVLEFAARLAQHRKTLWIRFVLVPGLTDNFEDIGNIADFAAGLGVVERVDVLPFHQLGRFKWKTLGLKYGLENTKPPSAGLVQRVCSRFRQTGLITH